jgi:hypothetical protein
MFILPDTFWEIRETTQKGRGVFALQDISPGTIIGDYLGTLVEDDSLDENAYGLYGMYFNTSHSILPKKEDIGIHILNHSCSANCSMYPYMGHMLYFVNRYIFSGEELCVQYLVSPHDRGEICNHKCYCHSPVCHGDYHISVDKDELVEQFIQHKDGEYRLQLPVPLNTVISKLPTYPERIEDDVIYDIFGALDQSPYECPDKILPPVSTVRKMIREHGRILNFHNLHTRVYGVWNGLIICMESNEAPLV